MSSIFGKLHYHQQPVTPEELSSMKTRLNHWKADADNIWLKGNMGLGHLMFYNTPESLQEKLPLHDNLAGITITSDARIDNREELFNKLTIDRTQQLTIPDSTLLLEAYKKYGEDCVHHIIGDFAFAICDEKEQKLFCARSPMGVRPFFYYQDNNLFAFASEKKGLLAISKLDASVDEIYLLQIAGDIWPTEEQTLYTHIKKLPSAHTLTAKNGRIALHKYWDLDPSRRIVYKNAADYPEAFREKFEEAVRGRLRSLHPVGVELSGGLDSSGIASMAADILHKQDLPITSLSFVAPGNIELKGIASYTEDDFIDEVCRFVNIDKTIKISSKDYSHFWEETELALFIGDGPEFYDPIWNITTQRKAAQNNIGVLLSGFPGDELVTRTLKKGFVPPDDIIRYFLVQRKRHNSYRAVKMVLSRIFRRQLSILYRKRYLDAAIEEQRSFTGNLLTDEAFRRLAYLIAPNKYWPKTIRELQVERVNTRYTAGRMEIESRNGLVNRLEPRFPMADTRLLEFALAIPDNEKSNATTDRLLFRNAMKGRLPDRVLYREKGLGVSIPFAEYEWVNRQSVALQWLMEKQKTGKIPPYIDCDKLFDGYHWELGCTQKHLRMQERRKVEYIIKWMETINFALPTK